MLTLSTQTLSLIMTLYVLALAGVAQWIECRPENQGIAGSIPSQGTCLGCSLVGGMRETTTH